MARSSSTLPARAQIEIIKKNLANETKKKRQGIGRAAVAEMKIEAKESEKKTPVKSGKLRDSTRVIGPEFEGDKIRVTIAVGGGEIDYAWYVHEDLDAHHDVGEAKFLERTLQESSPYLMKRIAERYNSEN